MVLQSVSDYLPLTERWLYHQIEGVRQYCSSEVVCERFIRNSPYDSRFVHHARSNWITGLFDRSVRRLGHPEWMRAKLKIATDLKITILHSHFADLAWSDREVARRAKVPHIVSVYGYDVSSLPARSCKWKGRYRRLFSSADLVLCEGPVMATRVVELGCPQDRVCVHHLGVPSDRINFRPLLRAPTDPFRVLLSGTFTEKKGLPSGLDALAVIKRNVPISVTVIGDSNGTVGQKVEKERISEAVGRGGLGDSATFLGYQPYERLLAEAYKHHVFLCPSRTACDGDSEGGAPVTLLDMAATGLPIVSTLHADIPYVLSQGKCALLAPEGDVDRLAWCLESLAQSDTLRIELAQAARRRVEAEFDQDGQARRLHALYRKIAG